MRPSNGYGTFGKYGPGHSNFYQKFLSYPGYDKKNDFQNKSPNVQAKLNMRWAHMSEGMFLMLRRKFLCSEIRSTIQIIKVLNIDHPS